LKLTDFIERSLTENTQYINLAIKGLTSAELAFRPKPHSNSIAFLMWHLARVEDLWIVRILLGEKETYEVGGWYRQFGTPAQDNGFGYGVKELDAWPVPGLDLLQSYSAAVRARTLDYLKKLCEKELETSRDFRWSKGTTGTALSHLVSEVGEHTGQIGYIRGFMKGIEPPAPPPGK
jgi:uncharacterized damage-inducible protein DinB